MTYDYTKTLCEPFSYAARRLPCGVDPNQTVLVLEGEVGSIQPAGYPAPDWFIAVNPYGYFDENDNSFDLNEVFEPGNVDASFALLSEADFEKTKEAILIAAKVDADDHLQCQTGGMYCIWVLQDGRMVIGGIDNGGGTAAADTAITVAKQQGTVEITTGAAHFDPKRYLEIYD